MRKLVVLKLDGDLEQGVRVTLEIGEEDSRPSTEITAQLPPYPDLVTAIDQWQSTYRSLGQSSRLEPKEIVYGGSIAQWRSDCDKSVVDLRSHLHNWLLSESFRPIREKWLQQLSPSDEVRVLIRSSSLALRKLPWHLWDLVEDYPKAEVAYCAPESEQSASSKTPTYRDKVRILAILGNSKGINVQKDRELLENLPDAVTTFLVEPQRQDINDQLWNQPWDILFFAGHSQSEGDTGRIFINQNDSLTIAQLKYALRNAVASGLQLAIFNSCDGLGLAIELQELHVGQMIVMREPVPDLVAQKFLTDFLAAFATGKSFYLAEREAREKLHGLEDKFPCASWLPVIFQNPAAVPPMWQDLGRRPTEVCPYRGLFAFREEDAPFFYGRDVFTQMLVEAVQQQSLVAVIGPSGSGKSSVVFAGLIPQLRSEGKWRIVSLRPGDRPFRNLSAKLVPLLETQMSETDQLVEINKQTTRLQQGDLRLRNVVTRILEKNLGDRFLLVVDQFEELYTLCLDAQERLLFLDNLLETCDHTPNFTLVLTLRADFLGQALSYRPLGDALQYADLKLSPMNREELQAAVEQPAPMLGVTIESGLTERIIDAVSAEPGDLPLLEFALNQLWAKQRDAQLTHAAYEEIGGVEAALSRYAEEAYGRLNEEEKERARRIFIQLVRPGEGTEDTRRLATRTEVGEENWDLVTRLADARLVVSSRDETLGEQTIEIVHEALIGGWERLRLWIEVDRSFRTWQEQLRASLRQWESSGKDEGALLRGVPLVEAEVWLKSRPMELSSVERSFLEASVALREREQEERERNRRRTKNLLFSGLVGALSLLAIAGLQWQRAEYQKQQAELNELNALIASSEALFLSNKKFDALIDSLKAGKKLKQAVRAEANIREQAVKVLQQLIFGVQEINRLEGHENWVYGLSFSPDRKTIATASADNKVKLWKLDGTFLNTLESRSNTLESRSNTLESRSNWVYGVSFSPDGKIIAIAGRDKTIQIWRTLDGTWKDCTLLRTLNGHTNRVYSVSFSPDGKTIATASWDKTVRLWSLDGTELVKPLKHDAQVNGVSFSADGRTIATASDDKKVRLWTVDGTLLRTLNDHKDKVYSVSFSPDGKTIASASWDKTVKLWKLDGSLIRTLEGHTDRIFGVSFSPDGKTIATASWDRTVKLWNQDGTLRETLKGHTERVLSVSFSLDGKMIASAGADNTVKLWRYDNRWLPIQGHDGVVRSVSFSPDGKMIASASSDHTAKLWNRDGTWRKTLKHDGEVYSVSFSPDSKMIATTSADNTTKLWNQNGTWRKTLKGHSDEVFYANFSPDGKTIATASADNTAKLWNQDGTILKTLKGHEDRVVDIKFSPDGTMIATASDDSTAKLWRKDGTVCETLNGHGDEVNSVSFSPDSKMIATASDDKIIGLWKLDGTLCNTSKGYQQRFLKDNQILTSHQERVLSVKFSPDGKTLASASFDKMVKLWKRDGTLLQTFQGHDDWVWSVDFSPDGKTLASASSDEAVRFWNIDNIDNIKSQTELDYLLIRGCNWLHDYLKTNPKVQQSDRHLCDGIGSQK